MSDYFGVSLDILLRGEEPGTVQLLANGQRKDFDRMCLRILVNSAQGDIVDIIF